MSKLRTDFTPDDPVVLSAGYAIGSKADRRGIDDQVLDLQRAVTGTLRSGVASYFKLSASAASPIVPGMAFCPSVEAPAGTFVTPATAAALVSALPVGVALEKAPAGSFFRGMVTGLIDHSIFNLGAGSAAPLAVDTSTGMLRRVVTPAAADVVLGACSADGTCTITAAAATDVHGDQKMADGLHGTFWKTFPDANTRRLWPITVLDIGKRALQLDDSTIYDVIPLPGSSPVTYVWSKTGAGPEATFSGDFGALLDSLCGAGTTVGFYGADRGLTKTGSIVNTWANQIVGGSAFSNMTEGAAGVGIGGATTGPGSKGGVASNGTTQFGKITSVPQPMVAPATQGITYIAIMRSLSAPPGSGIIVGPSFNLALMVSTGLAIKMYNGVDQIGGTATAGAWNRVYTIFTGTTNDAIKLGSNAEVTGTNSGNAGAGGNPIGVFADPSGSFGFNATEMACLLISRASKASIEAAMPTLNTQFNAWYGAGVVAV